MNWRKEAISDLRELKYLATYVETYPDMLKELDARMTRVRSGKDEQTPVSGGGGTRIEDDWLSCIVKKDRLKSQHLERWTRFQRLKGALSILPPEERLVLEYFYIDRPKNHVDRLCDQLGYEKSQVYRLKDEALKNLTIALYGIESG
ncbi:MAG: DUF1492 domain-containing protein [Peptococcus niger]